MLLYPISWKGTLFLDNPNHSLKYSFMFALNIIISTHGEALHDSVPTSWWSLLKESVVLRKVMLVTMDGFLKAHWQRLTTVLARVKTRSFFLYQNNKKTDVWSNITVLYPSQKCQGFFLLIMLYLEKIIFFILRYQKLLYVLKGSTGQFFDIKGVDATEETQSYLHLTVPSNWLWITTESRSSHLVGYIRKRPLNPEDGPC